MLESQSDAQASTDPLIDLVDDDDEEVNERELVDRINRNLRLGRFVLLIVGDGIHEDVEQMADFLNQTPQLQFTLGLVEMGLYAVDPKAEPPEFYVQPRIVARTREVTRAVVEIKTTVQPDEVLVSVPPAATDTQSGRAKITKSDFIEQLSRSSSPKVVKFAEWVIEHAQAHGLTITWGDDGPLLKYEDAETGHSFTFGQLSRSGTLASTHRLFGGFRKHGLDRSICRRYLDQVAALIPGATVYTDLTPSGTEREGIGKSVNKGEPLDLLVTRGHEWFKIINATVQDIREALETRDNDTD